ncbi:uncharacterized protein TNCV_4881241 [Trichonephila clavipes]|nr:uncharacterized protein TNCV_4881241 [Trichonephila clavipes]
MTWTTPELAPPLLTTTPHQREDVSALDRLNVHRCPTRRVFSGTGLELMTYLPCSPPGGTIAYRLQRRSINCQVANRVTKNDADLALSPTFRNVSTESPL